MADDEDLANRVSGGGGLMVRIPAEATDALTERAHVEPMMMSGKAIRGWIRVLTTGLTTKRQLCGWVDRGVGHAQMLPAK